MGVRPVRLVLAIVFGALLQGVLLAFGLHVDLILARLCGGSLACYWISNGIYFTIGLATAMLVVPWGNMRSRLWVFGILIVGGLAIGIVATHGFPGKIKGAGTGTGTSRSAR